MEKTLNLASFEDLSQEELMSTNGGYTFLCREASESGNHLKKLWDIINPIVVAH